MTTPEQRRAELVLLLTEAERRRAMAPLERARLWHRSAPRTSQRRALSLLGDPSVLMALILGGNRTGKTEAAAMWALAQAAGLDACVERGGERIYWVRRWLALSGLPESMIRPGPGRVWVASPTFASACEQIRPKLTRWAPAGTTRRAWEGGGEGELRLPNGGRIISKAYRQYDADNQTWEGASIRGAVLDEQPNSYACLNAVMSRLVDQEGQILGALTPLRGKADWLYTELIEKPPPWLRTIYLHGEDNPHIPQERRALMIAATPEWQRASRDRGAFTSPEGAIFQLDPNIHAVEPFEVPLGWRRWVGVDWGARNPHIVWCAEDPADGILYAYREIAHRRLPTEPAISDRQLVTMAMQAEEQAGETRCDVWRVADSESPGAISEALLSGWAVYPAQKGPGSVLAGLSLMEALLQTVDPMSLEPCTPRVRIVRSACPHLWSELEGLRWAEVRPGTDPRPDPRDPDHGPDALRYLVQHRARVGMGR